MGEVDAGVDDATVTSPPVICVQALAAPMGPSPCSAHWSASEGRAEPRR